MSKALVFVSHPASPAVRQSYIDALSPLAEMVFGADLGPAERHTAFAAAKVLARGLENKLVGAVLNHVS